MLDSYETHVNHEIPPVVFSDSKVLILGTFPSVKSRESKFYYGHPQNRFWKILAQIYREELPCSIQEKKDFLKRNHIALWDVIHSCKIKGSSDSSIQDVVANPIEKLLMQSEIDTIYVNGKKASQLYLKYVYENTKVKAITLPSSSPANAMFSLDKLVQEWGDKLLNR